MTCIRKPPVEELETVSKKTGKYISIHTLSTHSITQLNKNCVYN